MASPPAVTPTQLRALVCCAAVFLPSDPPREGRVAFWRHDGGLPEEEAPADREGGGDGPAEELLTVALPDADGGVALCEVPAQLLPVADAVPVLTRARAARATHPAAAFWGTASLLALQLAARGRLLPGLSPAGYDAWRLGPLDPADLARLRDYQVRGLGWLHRMTSLGLGACLADDMGPGKTITLISLHLHRQSDPGTAGPTLVVCPTSLMGNWQREIEKFAPGTPVRRFHAGRRSLAGPADGEIVLTTYGTMRLDAGKLAAVDWGLVVADEAQHIKNPSSATAKALRTVPSWRRSGRRSRRCRPGRPAGSRPPWRTARPGHHCGRPATGGRRTAVRPRSATGGTAAGGRFAGKAGSGCPRGRPRTIRRPRGRWCRKRAERTPGAGRTAQLAARSNPPHPAAPCGRS